jgi:hypothetical protein
VLHYTNRVSLTSASTEQAVTVLPAILCTLKRDKDGHTAIAKPQLLPAYKEPAI